jgi:transposase
MEGNDQGVAREWRMPDDMWERIKPLWPKPPRHPRGGRPRIDHRKIADGISHVLRSGCQWKAVPREFGSGRTLHRRFELSRPSRNPSKIHELSTISNRCHLKAKVSIGPSRTRTCDPRIMSPPL